MKRILIISDSHGMNTEMVKVIGHEAADLVIHAGDYGWSIDMMKRYFDYFVDGNNDYDWKKAETFTFANLKFILLHGDEYWSWNEDKWHERLRQFGKEQTADVVIFGHSHKEYINVETKPYLINPGSISLPRNNKMRKSYLIMLIDKDKIDFQIKYL